MAKIEYGEENKAVKGFQKNINTVMNATVVPENGIYDDDTMVGVKKFQAIVGINQSGMADKKTLNALTDALNPRIVVTYKGKVSLISKSQYDALVNQLGANLSATAGAYARTAGGVRDAWVRHNKARSQNWFWAEMVDAAVGGRGFPPDTIWKDALKAAAAMQKAAGSRNLGAMSKAFAGEVKIREAVAAMSQYEDELYGGGTALIAELGKIRDGAKITLAVCAALHTGGASLKIQVVAGAGTAAYDTMLGEISKAGTDPKQTWMTAFGSVVTDGVAGGVASRLLGGKAGKAFTKALGDYVAKHVVGSVLKNVGQDALKTYVAKSVTEGAKSEIENFIKRLAKACNPKSKMTFNQVVDSIGKDFVKGAAFGQLDTILGGFSKNIGKHLPESAWRSLGDLPVPYDELMKGGGLKILEQAYDKHAPDAVRSAADYPPRAKKINDFLKKKITTDAQVKAQLKKLAQQIEKKKKK